MLDAAVERAYRGQRRLAWYEVYAGEKAQRQFGEWLPDATVEAYRRFRVGIKGPLTTPVGKGIRSLNVALRQLLDLYVCLRPVRWFTNVPSPVLHPEDVDMVIFRENTEDIYAGIEWAAESPEAAREIAFQQGELGVSKIRFPATSGIGIKPVSREGTERLVRAAIRYALEQRRSSVTLVHKGNIMKYTEGAFRDWGYALARREFRDRIVTEREQWILDNAAAEPGLGVEENARRIEPGYDMAPPEAQAALRAEVEAALALQPTHGGDRLRDKLVLRDAIADITLQQVLTRPKKFDVIATLNLNGDYLSDALAAQVGGIGIAPVYPIAQAFKKAGNKVVTIIGARTRDLLFYEEEHKAVADEFYPCTDDGSYGHHGFVSDVLKQLLDRGAPIKHIMAIGPVPMMRVVSKLTAPYGVSTWVSLNPLMIDGTGMCGGCRVKIGEETKFACVDGPDFDGHLVDFDLLTSRLTAYREQERRAMKRLLDDPNCRLTKSVQAFAYPDEK